MKKLLFVVFVVSLVGYFSCTKGLPDNNACTAKPVLQDKPLLVKFTGDSIPFSYDDSSGLMWHIIDSGNSNHPVFSSTITVTYVGRLMSNAIFDSASNTNLNGSGLYNLIMGWRLGIPKIGVGGHIQLFIPSQLAWGCTGYGPVPADAPVFFDVKLLGVN